MIIKAGETKTEKYQGVTLDGINFNVMLKKLASETPMSTAWVSLAAVFVRATLSRGAKRHELFSGSLKAFAIESAFNASTLGMALETGDFVDLTDDSFGSAEMGSLPLQIDLGAVLNLRKSDVLEVEISVEPNFINSIAYPDHKLDENQTFIEVTANEAIGVETHIPFISMYALTNSDNRVVKNLGDNVTSVSIINLDRTGYGYNEKIVKNLTLNADKIYINDNFETLVLKQMNAYNNLSVAGKRSQNFNIYEGIELDKVTADLNLHNERIIAGKNFLMFRHFYTDSDILQLAKVTQEIHQIKGAAKVGVTSKSTSGLQAQKESLITKNAK